MGKLAPAFVRTVTAPGLYQDGDGLMLSVSGKGAKSWLVKLQAGGKRREYGLGSFKDVTLTEARDKARDYRRMLRAGIDPLAAKRRQATPTFKATAKLVHGEHKPAWRNSKHGAQWLATMEAYVFPRFGDVPVDQVDTGHVRDALAEIWLTKPETARRVRQRIGTVLDYAHGKGWRPHGLPMAAVNKALPRQPRKSGHHAAMPHADVPAFTTRLQTGSSMGRLAMEALVLTAARSGEVRGAAWDEVDMDTATWTIPAERMKAGKAHIVPLSPQAMAVFRRAEKLRLATSDVIFHGSRGKLLSDMTLLKIMRDAELPFTVHGFRSSFRDWVAEETAFPGEVAEAALAHAIPNRIEAAYRRTDFLDKRRKLMAAWGSYCTGDSQPVHLAAAS